MQVGILGAGRLGGTLARLFGARGHEVSIASARGREALAVHVDGWPSVRAVEAADLGDCEIVVLALPWTAAEQALAALELDGLVVVDATNAFDAEYEPIDAGPGGSTGTITRLLPGARVVKAFNTVAADLLVEDAHEGWPTARRIGVPVASDDAAAGDEVADLLGDIGFSAVHVGDLHDARRLMEPASPLFNVPLPADELEARLRQLDG